jgi:hypothetical protein
MTEPRACPSWLRLESPHLGLGHVGVVIGPSGANPHGHVGLAYREREQVRFLHLEWHYWLSHAELHRPYAWVVSPLPAEHAMLVAARCRRIARLFKKGLPYAPRFRATRFDDDSALVLGEGEHGFTCATFVLAVFEHAGLPLLDIAAWPVRPEDEPFRDDVVRSMIKELSRLPQRRKDVELTDPAKAQRYRDRLAELERHIPKVQAEPISARFRPEEVAAASSFDVWPAAFEPITERSRLIAAQLAAPPSATPPTPDSV